MGAALAGEMPAKILPLIFNISSRQHCQAVMDILPLGDKPHLNFLLGAMLGTSNASFPWLLCEHSLGRCMALIRSKYACVKYQIHFLAGASRIVLTDREPLALECAERWLQSCLNRRS